MVVFNKKNKKRLGMLLIFPLILLTGCSSDKVNTNKLQDKLIISTFSVDNKGSMELLDVNSKKQSSLIRDRKVAISGDLSNDESKVAYVDALNDSDPWQIYIHDLKNNKTSQVTTDIQSKGDARFLHNNLVYYLTVSNEMTKIAKVDTDKKSTNIIDKANLDREAEAFDVKEDKMIISTCSNSLNLKTWEENGGEFKPIPHIILEGDTNGESLKEIGKVTTSYIDSISYSSNPNEIIICGTDINGNPGSGIYELSIDTGKVTTILTDNIIASIKDSAIKEISRPILASSSKDENIIYFTGVAKESKQVTIAEIETYPSTIFSYNIKTKEIKEIYNPKILSKIFDLNIK